MPAEDPVAHGGSQDDSPVASKGFGPREQADETRQASQGILNDAELDVNFQQIMVRSQALTVDVVGKDFATGHKRLDMIQERFLAGVKSAGT